VKIHVVATSFFSTHHGSAADVLAGRERPVTAPTYPLLAGRARRFTSLATQMHMEVLGALPVEPTTAVFATVDGEIQTAEKLIADFPLVSGARFALSVHNSPSGVYSVATGSTSPTTTVTGSNALAAGWLEAALTAHDRPVLLSIADEPVPSVFQGPTQTVGVAAGFLLGAHGRRAELVMASGETEAVDADVRCAQSFSRQDAETPRREGAISRSSDRSRSDQIGSDQIESDPLFLASRRFGVKNLGTPNVGIDTLQTLAQIAEAFARDDASVITLGSVQPGTTLELHVGAR
jgi:Beta-ketoacyl synthase, N-terminal domain